MKQVIKKLIKSSLQHCNIGIIRYDELAKLRATEKACADIAMLSALPNEHASQLIRYLRKSKSQLRQDLFALSELNFKTNGYFVEFGSANGIDISNTYLMEKEFGWKGILAEPAKCWHDALKKNRSANIEHNCVWRDSSSTLSFNEVDSAEFSTINLYSNSDTHSESRKRGRTYDVKTISLNDLLLKYDAPNQIDYLSIDTEGSEFEILNSFDFSKFSFGVITCEHNFTPMREQIFSLLSKNGYVRKFQQLSRIDDWYVKSD
jgi:FkbM family methyltransferase